MTFFKKILVGEMLLLLLLIAAPVMAADDVTTRALKLYEKHRYEDAARLLRPELAAMDAAKLADARLASASLALGMIYLASAKLYSELHQTALLIQLDYFALLSKQKTGTASRMVDLYLGQVLLDSGKPAEAAIYLQRAAEQADAKSPVKVYAAIELGIAYSRQKLVQKATQQWSGLDTKIPEFKAALAGAYAVTGAQEFKPVAMADAALSEIKALQRTPDMRMLRNLLRAYSHGGAPEKALALLNTNELKEASYVEELGSSKTISFYDSNLMQSMAKTYLHAAVLNLERANQEASLRSAAAYYLAEGYLLQGNINLSLHTLTTVLAQDKLPLQIRNGAQVKLAIALNRAGQKTESTAIWKALVEKSKGNPGLLALLVQSCSLAGADCRQIVNLAIAEAEQGEGKKVFPLNAALGKYYLLQKDNQKAMLYMEAGRDKAHKNKIEVNDPVMLVGLAEAYYRNKKFSENLEIYFEIGKQYPVVRQIQDAMQGIYAMEQQSAGDVKIF